MEELVVFACVVAVCLLCLWSYDAGKKAGQAQLRDSADWWKE